MGNPENRGHMPLIGFTSAFIFYQFYNFVAQPGDYIDINHCLARRLCCVAQKWPGIAEKLCMGNSLLNPPIWFRWGRFTALTDSHYQSTLGP